MIESGAVGAVFEIINRASPVLKRIAEELDELQAQLTSTEEAMRSLAFPPQLTEGVAALETKMTRVAEASKAVGDESAAAFTKIDSAAAATAVTLGRVAAEMKGIAAEAKAVNGSAIGPLGAAAGGGGRGRGGMFHTTGPGASLGGSHIAASPSGDGFWGWVALFAGATAVKDVLAAGGDLETQKKLLRDKLGSRGTDADVDTAVNYAVKYAGSGGVIGTTPAENLKGIRELMSVTPTLEDAEALYPSMMKVSKALEELSGGSKKAEETMPVLAKALENLGGGIDPLTHKLDPERMRVATNEALKTIIAGGGFIDAQALFGLAKQAGGMGRLSDPGKLFDEVITSLIDMGGPRTGTALAATGRQFLGDKMTVQTAQELTDLGILPDGGWRKAGGTGIIMNPGVDIKGVDEIKDGRIADWFLDTVGPAIEAKYGANMSTADLIQESSKMFGQQTGQRLALMFLANEAQRQRDVAIKNSVDPSGVYQGIVDKDYGANLNNLGSAITGFAQVVGDPSIPMAIGSLHLLADAFHILTGIAASSPNAANAIAGTVFGPSMLVAGWGAAKDQVANLSSALGAVEKWWNGRPAATPYDNGGGPGDSFKGAIPSPLPVTVVGGVPDDLETRRKQFEKLNPTGALAPTVASPGAGAKAASVPDDIAALRDQYAKVPLPLVETAPLDAGLYERSYRAQQEHMKDPEAARGRAIMALPPQAPPVVNVAAPQVDTKVDVKVTASLDGIISQLAAKIERMVESSIRIPASSAGTDGRANHMPPDSYNF